jgi:uncharacterized repeat protein (TIGR01451 family)
MTSGETKVDRRSPSPESDGKRGRSEEAPSTKRSDLRRSLLMAGAALMLVVIGYLIVLLIGGQALRGLPGAQLIGRIGDRLGGLEDRDPAQAPLPALQATPGVAGPAPSPVAVPTPARPSPSFIPPAPDAPSIVTFTVDYENNTGVRLTGVRITDPIPAGTTYRTGSAVPDAAFNGTQLQWNIGTLNPGQTGRITFQVQTNRRGRISNTATIFSNEAPPSQVESSATVGE